MPRPKGVKPSKETLEKLYFKEKKTYREISKIFDVNPSAVYYWMKSYNITARKGWASGLPQILSHYKPTRLIRGEASEFEVGRVVGLLEGEGCIGINLQRNRGGRSQFHPYVHITNNNLDLLERCRDIIGGSVSFRRAKGNRRRTYTLRISNTMNVLETLKRLTPYLLSKGEQAKLVMEFCRRRLERLKPPYPKGYDERDVNIYARLKELNKRGRKPSA